MHSLMKQSFMNRGKNFNVIKRQEKPQNITMNKEEDLFDHWRYFLIITPDTFIQIYVHCTFHSITRDLTPQV